MAGAGTILHYYSLFSVFNMLLIDATFTLASGSSTILSSFDIFKFTLSYSHVPNSLKKLDNILVYSLFSNGFIARIPNK